MVPNEEKERSHYLVVKKLSALLYRITSKKGDFYCLNCLNSFRTENKLKSHGLRFKKYVKIKIFLEL